MDRVREGFAPNKGPVRLWFRERRSGEQEADMNLHTRVPNTPRQPVRPAYCDTAEALLSLSQTQRRLAHRTRSEALKWEAEGNHRNFASCMLEARHLWRDAKWHLQRAKDSYERAMK